MYQTYYGLDESPFRLNADTKFIYWSQTHQNAYRHLLYSVQSHKSLIVLAGAVGTGKTTLLHVLMEWVKTTEPATRIAYVVHSTLTITELLRYICHELGLDFTMSSKVDYVLALQRLTQQVSQQGERLLLILDEAQNYNYDVLEELRLLSNIETSHDKLLQIILAGQPQLLLKMKQQELYQLKQRVNVTYNLLPLNAEETHAYIQKRLDVAGAQGQALFHAQAIEAIYQYSQGLPRVINVMCDHALLYSFAANSKQVSESIIREVATDMALRPEQQPRQASPDAPGFRDEAAVEMSTQADHIVTGQTKPLPEKGSGETALFYGTLARQTYWEDEEKRHGRKRLLLLAGIMVFLIMIVAGMSFVPWPFAKDSIPGNHSSLRSEKPDNVGALQQNPQNIPAQNVIAPEKNRSKIDHTDVNTQQVPSKPPAEDKTPAPSNKNIQDIATRYTIVKSGDTFTKILLESYGKYDASLVALVLSANPDIVNVNAIFVGQLIHLPTP